MASLNDWVEGARLRTLPAAAAPVFIGMGGAAYLGGFSFWRSALALLVGLLLQVGVNFANDYSDGVRGTDEHRAGPPRLTAGGGASPRTVLTIALSCFGLAGLLGLVLLWISGQWVLLIPGVAAVVAAWFYTGGRHPYGYMGVGLSELFVFLFFGLFATVGTTWVQVPSAPARLWVGATGVGLLSIALLFINNIRDIPTDKLSGKRTLPVRLGDSRSRLAYYGLVIVGVCAGTVAAPGFLGSLCTLVVLAALAVIAARPVWQGASGRDLLHPLKMTGILTLAYGLLVGGFLALAGF
ncbi:1,4-dihydroxy-2-naphthoate polyprenyltransferase [Gleimia hominis]|uniref:1,4-dihydroxy-2-naphthoate octaprenyltransferase n=1 Tax=Gleimia hominis TaxID=595468 RepID=A0ABU3I9M4_9ACTO|nr:1,4-dihydroxy-2-naphthoate polyprenyltransferase [Gleimia hominis]MDT3767074.1 1,4-dihydroxy-2-naphthoate polyprenyltransferase [Gleimia hominis]